MVKKKQKGGNLSEKQNNYSSTPHIGGLGGLGLPSFLPGSSSGSGNSNEGGIMERIKSIFERINYYLLKVLGKIGQVLGKSTQALSPPLIVIRLIYLIIILIIMLISWMEWGPNVWFMYHLYSLLKFIFMLLLSLATIIIAAKLSGKLGAELNKDQDIGIPLQILMLIGFVFSFPYIYQLAVIVFFMGIIGAYYKHVCLKNNRGTNTNTWMIVDGVSAFFKSLALVTFIISIIAYKLKVKLSAILPLFTASLIFFIALAITSVVEYIVTNNVSYWMGIAEADKIEKEEDCYGDEEDENKSNLKKVLNILLSILLAVGGLVILILQTIPIPPILPINMKIIGIIDKGVNKIVEFVL
jgi:hypothetical protein